MENTASTTAAPAAAAASEQQTAGEQESSTQAQTKEQSLYDVKINGKVQKVPLDVLVTGYQQSSASQEKFRQSAELKKQADDMLGNLKKGDLNALMEVVGGRDNLRSIAEKYLLGIIEEEELSPIEKEKRALASELEALKKEKEERERKEKDSSYNAARKKAQDNLESQFVTFFDSMKEKNITPNAFMVRNMTETMLDHLEKTGSQLDIATAYKIANNRVSRQMSDYFNNISTDEILSILPPNVFEAVRKRDLEAVKSQYPVAKKASATSQNTMPTKSKVIKSSTDDYFNKLFK